MDGEGVVSFRVAGFRRRKRRREGRSGRGEGGSGPMRGETVSEEARVVE